MVLTKSNEIYLLDYKTGSHLPKHQAQLENYQKVIEEMGYKVVKKALIYIGENSNIVNL
jgi:RecB family exonuclease